MICVPDLDRGIDAYAQLGFSVHPGGVHTGRGTHNAIAFNDDDYLELLAIRDKGEYLSNSPYGGLVEFLERGGGLRYVVVQSDDLAADVAAMCARGADVSEATDGGRRTPAGRDLRWKAAMLGDRNLLPVFFVQHLTPVQERRLQVPAAGRHPNGVQRIERSYIAVTDLAGAVESYRRVLGVAPKMERGTVINADMAIFQLGSTGFGLAKPVGPGVCADALERRGPGPFQILYRTAAWTPPRNGSPTTASRRRRGESATPASRPCSSCRSMRAGCMWGLWGWRRGRVAFGRERASALRADRFAYPFAAAGSSSSFLPFSLPWYFLPSAVKESLSPCTVPSSARVLPPVRSVPESIWNSCLSVSSPCAVL